MKCLCTGLEYSIEDLLTILNQHPFQVQLIQEPSIEPYRIQIVRRFSVDYDEFPIKQTAKPRLVSGMINNTESFVSIKILGFILN